MSSSTSAWEAELELLCSHSLDWLASLNKRWHGFHEREGLCAVPQRFTPAYGTVSVLACKTMMKHTCCLIVHWKGYVIAGVKP